jgi:thiol-disulfide isomerase/thioredoxin
MVLILENDMTDKKPRSFPPLAYIGLAALAGVLSGAGAVYLKETGSGNGAAVPVVASVNCDTAKDKIATMTPFLKGQVAAMNPVANPRSLDALTFKDTDNKPLTLASFEGKTVLLNLWATWCLPCREEMPALNGLQKALGSDRFEVVTVNIDTGDDTKPKAFLSEIGVDTLGFYRDNTLAAFNVLKKEGLAFGLPATLLIDSKGCLIGSMNGPAAWDSPDAHALVKSVI